MTTSAMAPSVEAPDTPDTPDTRPVWHVPRIEWTPFGIGLAIAVFLAAPGTALVYAGLDSSWVVGINAGRAEGLQFGRDMVFTYGPWGYLDHPLPWGNGLSQMAVLYSTLVIAALFLTSYAALRRRWELSPVVAAACAAAVTVILGSVSERSALAVAACGLAALIHALALAEGARRTAVVTVLPVVIAVVAGLLVQVKLSVGVAAAVIAFLAALGDFSIRRLVVDCLATGAAFVASFVAFWLLAGQQLQWLPEWVRGSIEIVRGYPEAMASERADQLFGYLVGLVLVVFVVVQCIRLGRRVGLRLAIVPALLAGALGGFAFKAAFIRHDDHEMSFFTLFTAALLALAPLARHRLAAVFAVGAALVMVVPGTNWLDARAARDSWRLAIQVAADPSSARAYQATSKAQARATYQLPDEFLSAIADHPVWVDPYESAVAVDYEMNWHPLPVLQAYSAYTPYLDRLNARAARTAPDDQLVLRSPTATIDGRNPRWETPEYLLTLACQYTQELTDGFWSLMRHDAPRCGARQEVGQQSVDADETVTVPAAAPDQLVLASFEPDPEGLPARLGNTLLKDRTGLFVTADDTSYRLPEALAGGPLIVAYPDHGDQGLFPAYQYGELAFSEPGTVTFSTVQLDPPST